MQSRKRTNFLFAFFFSLVLILVGTAVVQAKFIIPTALISHWSFDDRPGDVAEDSIASNHGLILNGAERVKGQVKKARLFDGVNDYIEVADDSSLDITGNKITIEMWVYPESVSLENILIRKGSAGAGNYSLYIRNSQLALISGDSNNWVNRGTNSIITTGSWQYIVVTYDGSDIRYYIDGDLTDVIARDGVGVANGNVFSIGGPLVPGFSNSRHFKGMIDEVAIYSEPQGTEEIELHYLNGLAKKSYFHTDQSK